MPLDNWVNVFDDADYSKLSKTGKVCRFVNKAFERIEDDFIKIYGVNKEFLDLQRKKIEVELMRCQQVQTGDYSSQIFIDLAQDEIDKIIAKKSTGESKIRKMIPFVEHEMGGMRIDRKKTIVIDFYDMVNFISDKNK